MYRTLDTGEIALDPRMDRAAVMALFVYNTLQFGGNETWLSRYLLEKGKKNEEHGEQLHSLKLDGYGKPIEITGDGKLTIGDPAEFPYPVKAVVVTNPRKQVVLD